MSDDIVTRLRNDRCCFPECHWLQTDAADEIERLRAELAHAQSEIARLERLATNG